MEFEMVFMTCTFFVKLSHLEKPKLISDIFIPLGVQKTKVHI